MDTILDSSTTSNPSSIIKKSSTPIKALSAPLYPPAESPQANIKTQISAPSYFFSLRDNDAPPFNKPEKQMRPHILIGTVMTESEAVEMIAASDTDKTYGLNKWISNFLVEKKLIHNYNLTERTFLISLLTELIDYAAQRDFSAFKLALLITVYLSTHKNFKCYYWSSPDTVWRYFKEVMIRHTIEDSPDGQEVFTPEECYDIVTHFHTVYLSNLPLVHIMTFGAYRLKLLWPFKPK